MHLAHQRMLARQENPAQFQPQAFELGIQHAAFGKFQQCQPLVGNAHYHGA
ncbi:hypothetical protein D3C83_104380 [compost metagenome]